MFVNCALHYGAVHSVRLSDSGLCGQVVHMERWVSITEVSHGLAYSGLYRQVVLIQRCISITEVSHGTA